MQLTVCGSPRPRSSGWRVDAMGDYPAPGGELLWRSSLHPREFRRNTNLAETRKNRRLPGTTQRFAGLRLDGCKRIGAAGKSSRRVMRGSRLLRHFVVGLSAERNTARSPGICQSGSPPGSWVIVHCTHAPPLSRSRTRTTKTANR